MTTPTEQSRQHAFMKTMWTIANAHFVTAPDELHARLALTANDN